jgi:hypothetical protein
VYPRQGCRRVQAESNRGVPVREPEALEAGTGIGVGLDRPSAVIERVDHAIPRLQGLDDVLDTSCGRINMSLQVAPGRVAAP